MSKIAQNSACDMFPGSRSYLMKRFKLFFGDVLRHWLLKQDVWLTIFFISKQLLVQSLHDQDQIWWKVSNFSSETFLEKVDLSKIVNLAWTVLTLAWTYRKWIDLLSHDMFFFVNNDNTRSIDLLAWNDFEWREILTWWCHEFGVETKRGEK